MFQVWCLAQTLDIADLFQFFSSLVSFLFFCVLLFMWMVTDGGIVLSFHNDLVIKV